MISRNLFVESKKLRVFDFDDTLVKTTSFIYVTNNGKKKKLTPGEYAVYNEKPGDEFDFSDFSKVQNPDEREALHHPKRHYLNNMLGDPAFWLEKHEAKLAARDTVLIASDGLWDNLYVSEIIEIIQSGELEASAQTLAETAISRMTNVQEGLPSKPDDLTFVLFRLNATGLCEDAERHVDSGGR